MKRQLPRLSYANVVSTLCRFLPLGRGALAASALAAAMVAPAPAAATITVGSDLTEAASTQPSACAPYATSCTNMLVRAKRGNLYPAASPADGTLVGFGIKSGGAGAGTFRLLRLDTAIAAKVLLVGGVGTGPTVNLPGAGTFELPASLPIRAGDSLGIDSSGSTAFGACQTGAGGAESWRFSPPIADGSWLQPVQSSDDCELLVNAVVEPSASVGFGRGTVTRAGRTLLALRLPGPGVLTLSGSEIRTVARTIGRAGKLGVPVRLRPAARRRLASSGHARVEVSETFAPTGGVAASETATVNFKAGRR
jgi:hypothetical protein